MNCYSILMIVGLSTSLVSCNSRFWLDGEGSVQALPLNTRAFRFPRVYEENVKFNEVPIRGAQSSEEELKPMLKRATLIKRRGRELFGKRSVVDFDNSEGDMLVDARYRRRANELFGK